MNTLGQNYWSALAVQCLIGAVLVQRSALFCDVIYCQLCLFN